MKMKNKGIIPINKPNGWTSFDVVNKIKHMVKPLKVGHLGTLDPMATGVLLVTVGKATKLFDLMQEKQKTYVAEFEFGYVTDTLDATGEVIKTTNIIPTEQQIKEVLNSFIGKISQIPPKYSAKSVNGVRAYDLARNNQEFELKPKTVEIYNITLLSYDSNRLKLEISCGSGTYIRAIGRDVAEKLNSLATMISLVRTNISNYLVEDCFEIENINKDNVFEKLMPIQNFLSLPKLELTDEETFKLVNGQILNVQQEDGEYLVINKENEVAIAEIKENKAKMSIFLD